MKVVKINVDCESFCFILCNFKCHSLYSNLLKNLQFKTDIRRAKKVVGWLIGPINYKDLGPDLSIFIFS